MLKKEVMLLASLFATGMLTSGCSNENEWAIPAQPGEAIQFGVTDVKPMTRTVYEDSVTINWLKGDEIGICSTSDNVVHYIDGNEKHAKYKIDSVDADGHKGHASISPAVDGQYLKWGENLNTPATFYGAYPAERIVSYPTESSEEFQMQYHTSQVCKVVSKENGVYQTAPDMKNAYMVAKNVLNPTGDHVLLAFDPIMTTPEITITAGGYEVGTGIIQPVTVTGVSVIMPRGLKSETLNYSIPNVTFNNPMTTHGSLVEDRDVAVGAQSIFVQIDNDGRKYVDLFEGESITLTAFLPPISDLSRAKIHVHTLGAANYVLTINDNPKSQSKIRIKLPDITPETARPNNWISLLADKTPLKSMSIPAYVCNGEETETDFQELLQKGVRAFKLTGDRMVGQNPFSHYYVQEEICKYFNRFLGENSHELVVLWAEDNLQDSNKTGSKFLDDHLFDWASLSPNVGSLRGKVVLMQEWKTVINGRAGMYSIQTDRNKSEKICKFTQYDAKSIENFNVNSPDWTAQFYSDQALNKGIYKKIVDFTEQKGNTGIVTIPNAGATFDDSYGDFLLQSIIDCNFRFKSW